jgi:hypothetical protein
MSFCSFNQKESHTIPVHHADIMLRIIHFKAENVTVISNGGGNVITWELGHDLLKHTCRGLCGGGHLVLLQRLGPPNDCVHLPGRTAVFVQPCRLTMKLIQIGAKGDVQPFDTG